MRPDKLILAVLIAMGLATAACQRAEDEDLAETGDSTVIAVPDTSASAVRSTVTATPVNGEAAVTPASDRPEEIVIVREEQPAPAAPRRVTRTRAPVQRAPARGVEPAPEVRRDPVRPATATIPAGTNFFVTTETALSTKANQVGDPVAVRTAENINVNGQVVIPAGALVEGHVTAMKSAGNPGEVAYIDLAFDRVRLANGEWQPISGVLAGKAGEEVRGSANIPRNVAIGAGAGAVLGQVIGGDAKSTVIGAVIGAGAGAAAGEATRDSYVIVPSGSRINVQLTNSVTVPVR